MGLNQEFLELELFTYGLNAFSVEEFAEAGLNATDIELIAFMAEQEVGHAIMVANILGGKTMRQILHIQHLIALYSSGYRPAMHIRISDQQREGIYRPLSQGKPARIGQLLSCNGC